MSIKYSLQKYHTHTATQTRASMLQAAHDRSRDLSSVHSRRTSSTPLPIMKRFDQHTTNKQTNERYVTSDVKTNRKDRQKSFQANNHSLDHQFCTKHRADIKE